ncbi:MAG TPA: hypothetical protein VEC93_00520, partial [Anaerolineae bacterium]|nr:hypothetical protein [Anaerolineae bacterium]
MTKHSYQPKAQLIAQLTAARQNLADMEQQLIEAYSAALPKEQMLAAERERRSLIETLYQASTTLHSTLKYDEVLDHLLDQLPEILPHQAACIMLTQGETARIFRWHGYARFGGKNFVSSFHFKISEIPSLRTMYETGRSVVVPRATEQDA